MFFEDENFRCSIVHAAHYSWDGTKRYVNPRPFASLALRIVGTSIFDFDDGTHIKTKAGDILYVPEMMGYTVNYSKGEIVAINFRGENCGEKVEFFAGYDGFKFTDLFSGTSKLWNEQTSGYKMKATSLLYEIFGELSLARAAQARYNPGFSSAINYIKENFRDPFLTFPEVCAKCGISESVFRRCFKNAFEKSPVSYLTELRIQAAEQMLISEDRTIEEVAYECGFSDPKYFSRTVKKYRGVTPSQLRSVYR